MKQRILARWNKNGGRARFIKIDIYAELLGRERGWFYFNNVTTLWRLLEIVSCGFTYLATHLLNFMVDWLSRTPMQFIQPCQLCCLLAERILSATVSHPSTCWIFRAHRATCHTYHHAHHQHKYMFSLKLSVHIVTKTRRSEVLEYFWHQMQQ